MTDRQVLLAVGRFPFTDIGELSVFTGLPKHVLRRHVQNAHNAGHFASLSHSSPLVPRTVRRTLTKSGIAELGYQARDLQLSAHIHRSMLKRLDPLAAIYRTLEYICHDVSQTVSEFTYLSSEDLDVSAKLQSGLSLGFIRQGSLWGRDAFAGRVMRIVGRIFSPDLLLVLVPNEVELGRLCRRMTAESYPLTLGMVESEAATGASVLWTPLWEPEEPVSLREAFASLEMYGWMPDPPRFVDESPPSDDWHPEVPAVLLVPQQKDLLDLIGLWPRITRADLADMRGVSDARVKKLLNSSEMRHLYSRGKYGRKLTYSLSGEGIRYIASRDRTSYSSVLSEWGPDTGDRLSRIDDEADHTAGVHRAVSLLVKAVNDSSTWSLETLEPHWRAARAWYDRHRMRVLKPDALGVLQGSDGQIPFLLEYERRTRYRSHGTSRVASYLDYYRTGGWRQHWRSKPLTLFVFEDVGMESEFLRSTGRLLGNELIRATCLRTLEDAGALGAAWRVPGGNYRLTRLGR